MVIVAINCGSSSVKCAALGGSPLRRIVDIRVEQIGTAQATVRIGDEVRAVDAPDVGAAMEEALGPLMQRVDAQDIGAVVHRIVHGGERFTRPTRIDYDVAASIAALGALAPLHNLPALAAIDAARRRLASVAHYAVFDTAFHATLPPHARQYALPRSVRDRYGIRRFGFHGISHQHVMSRAAAYLGTPARELRIASCHLGNGASVTAIEYGRSIETSMGMTPLEGLVMGTRSGDVDPGILLELMRDHDRADLERLLMHDSGLMGLTGTNDMREIERRAAQGDENCALAIDLYAQRVRKYLGAYAAAMGGVDVIAFTGGVGENSAEIRWRCLQRLDFLGATLDENLNRKGLTDTVQCVDISAPGSRVRLLALRADEELAMAESVAPLLSGVGPGPNGANLK